jgi:hypothetical protein
MEVALNQQAISFSYGNVHAPTEDKIDDINDRFYEELEQVVDKFPKYNMKIC